MSEEQILSLLLTAGALLVATAHAIVWTFYPDEGAE